LPHDVFAGVLQSTSSSSRHVAGVGSIDEAIDSVLLHFMNNFNQENCVADLKMSICRPNLDLSATVRRQHDTINNLATRLHFVLSFFGKLDQ